MSRLHLATIASLPCVLCELLGMPQTARTQVHHLREGVGMGQRNSDMLTIPLCADHHTGQSGIHGDRSALRLAKVEELDLLDITLTKVMGYDRPRAPSYKRPSKVLPRCTDAQLEVWKRRNL